MKKYVSKKLRGKDEPIQVSTQILRWRQKMQKLDIQIGRATRKAKEDAKRQRKAREVDSPDKLIERFKKQFGK